MIDIDAVADLAVADLMYEQSPEWLPGLNQSGREAVVERLAEELWTQTEYPAPWEGVARRALNRARRRTGGRGMTTERYERRQCVDCPPGSRSAAKFPGPRCRSHHSRREREASKRQHDRMLVTKYGITGEQYDAIFEAQGWWCAICNLAIGSSKRLAVDHDHRCCRGSGSCGRCVRGLLCNACNRFLMIIQDNPEAFLRGYEYLTNPPARKVLNRDDGPEPEAVG